MSKRALVLRLGALGDVVLATPAVRALAKAGFAVDWVTDSRLASMVEGHAQVRKVWPLDRSHGFAGLWRLALALRRERYDLVVDLHNKLRTRILGWLSGAPRRLVFRKRRGMDLVRAALGRLPPLTRAHAVDLYLEALEPLGVESAGRALSLPRASGEAAAAAERLLGAEARPLVALAPGAAHPTKRWPAARFAALGDSFAARGAAVVLVGGPADAPVLDEVRAAMRASVLADTRRLDAAGVGAALQRCALLVSNDTGPVHIAAAHGTPVVALYGPTSPARWGPVGVLSRTISLGLPCSPCTNHGGARCPLGTHACMEDLPVERVAAVALDLFEHARAGAQRGVAS